MKQFRSIPVNMNRTLLMVAGLLAIPYTWGQVKKQFSVEPVAQCELIRLSLKTKSGNCFVRPSQNNEFLNVYSNQDPEEYGHSFLNEVAGNICRVRLALDQEGRTGLSRQLSSQVFGREGGAPEKLWKVYLTESRPYDLDLVYGFGNANVDLSGLAIRKLKINTGSAAVKVGFVTGMANKVVMDTFFVKVDVGTVDVRQINLCRSKVVVADVGFGNMQLDFSDRPAGANRIYGSVGAGNLTITLPPDEVPVMVKIKNSWLCSVSLTKRLQSVGENVFANAAYSKNSKDALIFDLDVSLGNIDFR